jgi:predicted glycogen debranching enzyme
MNEPLTELPVVRRIAFGEGRPDWSTEWLVTNGLGGYASGPVGGGITRRYHGLLVAALPAPLGRTLYLSHVRLSLVRGQQETLIDHEDLRALNAPGVAHLLEFRVETGLPIWTYAIGSTTIETRVVMPFRQNTTHLLIRVLTAPEPVQIRLAPMLDVRPHEGNVSTALAGDPVVSVDGQRIEIRPSSQLPALRCHIEGANVHVDFGRPSETTIDYVMERERGYDHEGPVWSPGHIDVQCREGDTVVFTASTEDWPVLERRPPAEALEAELVRRAALLVRAGSPTDLTEAELTLAADQFLITPAGRTHEVEQGRAEGEEPRTVIAGYHWFTDWGRDTMISLEGLTLDTGRTAEAKHILHTFARHVRDGLIPNLFPEGEHQGLYHTADATLWFFHAVSRYVDRTGDRSMLDDLLPIFLDIIEHHIAGTRFGIRVDPADGLLTQGAEHYQLTWMDAKVGDWVVTPRRGKAVEINALWYNALRTTADWLEGAGRDPAAETLRVEAARVREAFNRRFWNAALGYLFDVVDGEPGDDPACRPNQVLAISLPHPVLDPGRWEAVLGVVERVLLTPVGLRSLAPGHPDYRATYFGDLHSRDAAYHQGTVWAWLIGPFVDAWIKVHPSAPASDARQFLTGFLPHLDAACVGSISEIFDADRPFTPRGCIAQAWSVAEVLRTWRKTRRATTEGR